MAQGIRADAERQAVVIRADAEKTAEEIRGEGDARATATYAEAFNADPEFYEFTRSLNAHRRAFSARTTFWYLIRAATSSSISARTTARINPRWKRC